MQFDSSFLGPQGALPEDGQYNGSRYAEVREACLRNAYYLTWGKVGEPPLPVYDVTLGRVLKGFLPGGNGWKFLKAADRSLSSESDLRWGPDGMGYRRLLHPNAVCLFGEWIIDQPTPYTGYFQQGSRALIVGRYSTCCAETRRGHMRSLSLVGKLYPTTDPGHLQPLRTANFITQEDLGGQRTEWVSQATLRNAPNVSPWRRGFGLPVLLLTGFAFMLVDREPTIRQLYPIAELEKPSYEPTRAPQFMQLTMQEDYPPTSEAGIDFRDEVLRQIYDRGDPSPKRSLFFNVEVTDNGESRGALIKRRTFADWKKIGRIEFKEAVASYNGDFVLHFHHPPWRENRNDPRTDHRRSKRGS
jgi:hypothetical protein